MGKLDSMMKCAQAKNLLNENKIKEALQVVEEIDIERIKSISDFKTVAQVYMDAHHYAEARDVYFHIYDRIQTRNVLYYMVYLSARCGMIEEAEDFFEEYKRIDDSTIDVLILEFYLERAKGAGNEQLIQIVQKILAVDYLEEWAYELAKLYHKEGMQDACVAECSKIILWFGEGVIVEKAMLLKLHYVDGMDISSPKAIEETRNLATELKIAAEIARRQEEAAQRAQNTYDEKLEQNAQNLYDEEIEQNAQDLYDEEIEQNVQNQSSEEIEAEEQELEDFAVDIEDYLFDGAQGAQEEAESSQETEIPDEEVSEELLVEDNLPKEYSENAELPEEHEEPATAKRQEDVVAAIISEAKSLKKLPHFMIVGEDQDKAMELIKALMRGLCDQGMIDSPRIARITAEKINRINLEDKKAQLENSCLLIEQAHELSIPSLQTLCQMMKRSMNNTVVGVFDDKESMQKLLNKNRKLRTLLQYEIQV